MISQPIMGTTGKSGHLLGIWGTDFGPGTMVNAVERGEGVLVVELCSKNKKKNPWGGV